METTSYWVDSSSRPRFSKLDRNIKTDVVVIGAGITGITAAYLIKKAGRKVALIDRERGGGVDSSYTTAHLTAVTDLRFHELVRYFGRDHTKAVWDAGSAAIDEIYRNVRQENISCEFKWVSGYLHAPLTGPQEDEIKSLKKDAKIAAELGVNVDFIDSIPLVKRTGIEFRHQAKFHPLKYLTALIKQIPGNGSHVFENTTAEEVTAKPLSVKCGQYTISCDYLVLATHTPLMGNTNLVSATLFQTKLALYSTYVVGAKIPRDTAPEASFWDTADPYHYLRIDRHRDFDYAIFGGEDHKTGQAKDTEKRYARLDQRLLKLIPKAKIDHHWSGQVIETNDGLPLIGETAERQFAATGFSGNGMTFGTLGAMMARDAIAGTKNPWKELFDVHRKKLHGGAWDYLQENADYPYYMVRDRVARVEKDSDHELKPGEGRILKHDGKKVAAYRDDKGKVTRCSPVCTHMGCIVHWNTAEKTWDCPCHGSRFHPTGEVMSGPAESPLTSIEEKK